MAVQAQTGSIGQQPGPWARGLALSMIAVALILTLVVANQIGGILIAKDLRDEYQQLVNGTRGLADRPCRSFGAGDRGCDLRGGRERLDDRSRARHDA